MAIYKKGNSYGDSRAVTGGGSRYTPGEPTAAQAQATRTPARLPNVSRTPAPVSTRSPEQTPQITAGAQAERPGFLPSYEDYTSGRTTYDNYARSQLVQGQSQDQYAGRIDPIGGQGSYGPVTDPRYAQAEAPIPVTPTQIAPTEVAPEQQAQSRYPILNKLRSFQDFFS